jgi:hypothetical protein
MMIKLYSVDYSTHGEAFEWEGHAREFADNNGMCAAEYAAMCGELAKSGRFWVGGGAAPLFLVVRNREVQ